MESSLTAPACPAGKRFAALAALAIGVSFLLTAAGGFAKPQADRTPAPLPTPRSGLSAAVVAGRVYVLGGSAAGVALAVVEEYEPQTDRWRRRAEMPAARELFGAAVVDERIYVIGGTVSGPDKMARVDIYDPALNRWSRGKDMPTPRNALSTVAVNGKIYAIGGWGTDADMRAKDFPTVEVYEPRTDTWVTAAEMPTPRSHMAAVAVDGKIYAMGGWVRRSGEEVALTTVEVYDVAADAWTAAAAIPTARFLPAGGVRGGRIYVLGGWTTAGNERTALAAVDVFDPAKGEWAADSDLAAARVAHSVATLPGGFYLFGGASGGSMRRTSGSELARVEAYRPSDPSLLTWTPDAEPARPAATQPGGPASVAEFRDGGGYGRIIEVEASFGNLQTSFVESDMSGLGIAAGASFSLRFGDTVYDVLFGKDFSDVSRGEWVAFVAPDGTLTIARNFASAHDACECSAGDMVFIAPPGGNPSG